MKVKRSYQKVTANWKRIMSRLLVLAMVMTSLPITQVQAAGLSTENQVESVETEETETAEASPAESAEPDSADNEGTAPTESTEEASEEGTEAGSTEAVTPEIVGDSTSIISPEVNNYEVTFRYKNDSITEVSLVGSMNGNGGQRHR